MRSRRSLGRGGVQHGPIGELQVEVSEGGLIVQRSGEIVRRRRARVDQRPAVRGSVRDGRVGADVSRSLGLRLHWYPEDSLELSLGVDVSCREVSALTKGYVGTQWTWHGCQSPFLPQRDMENSGKTDNDGQTADGRPVVRQFGVATVYEDRGGRQVPTDTDEGKLAIRNVNPRGTGDDGAPGCQARGDLERVGSVGRRDLLGHAGLIAGQRDGVEEAKSGHRADLLVSTGTIPGGDLPSQTGTTCDYDTLPR